MCETKVAPYNSNYCPIFAGEILKNERARPKKVIFYQSINKPKSILLSPSSLIFYISPKKI